MMMNNTDGVVEERFFWECFGVGKKGRERGCG